MTDLLALGVLALCVAGTFGLWWMCDALMPAQESLGKEVGP